MESKELLLASTIAFLVPVAFNLTKVGLPLKYVDVGISEGLIILPVLLNNILQMFGRPFSGYLSERLGHKRVFSLAPLVYALSFVLFYIAKSPIEVYIASLVLGVGISFFWPGFLAYSSYLNERESESVATILSVSYVGAFIGTVLSGALYEVEGMRIFIISAGIMIIPAILGTQTSLTGAIENVSIGYAYRTALKSMKDTIKKANSISLVPIINTYAPIFLINAGLRPTIVGLILTILPLMSAMTQQVGGRFYHHLVPHRRKINLSAILMLSLFAITATYRMLFLLITTFIAFSILSSLLFTPQLTKSLETDRQKRGLGSGGFGAGMNLARVLASTMATSGGYLSEQGYIPASPGLSALLFTSVGFALITIIQREKKREV